MVIRFDDFGRRGCRFLDIRLTFVGFLVSRHVHLWEFAARCLIGLLRRDGVCTLGLIQRDVDATVGGRTLRDQRGILAVGNGWGD